MDYEKKYKRLYNFISDLYPFMSEYCKEKVEGFLPELCESEDERIRKFLIKWIQDNYYHGTTEIPTKTLITWLEKQGEKSLTVDIESMIEAYEQRLINQGNGVRNSPIVNMCVAAFKHGVENTLDELHLKQGEPSIKWNKNTEGNKPQVNHSVLMKTFQGIAEGEWKGEYWEQYRWAGIVRDSDVLSWMELSDLDKQGEQKPTLRERYKNIAESEWFKKTHEGMSISDDEKVDNINKIEPKFKVGDWIIYSNEEVDLITGFDDDGYFVDEEDYIPFYCEGNMRLFTIQDAKELKKIEQKPTQVIKPFEAEHGKYYYCIKDYFCGGRKQASKGDVVQALRGLPIMGLKDASEYFLPVNSIKCNFAWSEEDENYLNTTIAYLKDANEFKKTAEKCITWLKSLRPQNHWKPSDEQMKALDSVIDEYDGYPEFDSLVSLKNDLRKL